MRLFAALNRIRLEVDNKFYTEAVIEPIVSGEWKGFPGGLVVGNRNYAVYRGGGATGHATSDGQIIIEYSEDNGENWQGQTEIYDGSEIPTEFPQIWIEYPDAELDCRDPKLTLLNNNKILLSGFISIKNNDVKIYSIVYAITYNYSYNIIDPTYTKQSIFYVDDHVRQGGSPIIHKDIIYAPFYREESSGAPSTEVYIYKSLDNGLTFTKVSTVMPVTYSGYDYKCNESTICMIGEKMIMQARQVTDKSVTAYCESNNYGVTWGVFSLGTSNLDGLNAKYLGNGKVVFVGRESVIGAYKTMLYVIDWTTKVRESELEIYNGTLGLRDQGYSTIEKYRDRYFITYYYCIGTPTGVFFRQLIYNEDTYTFSFT